LTAESVLSHSLRWGGPKIRIRPFIKPLLAVAPQAVGDICWMYARGRCVFHYYAAVSEKVLDTLKMAAFVEVIPLNILFG
jgi:hypothetical protein